MTRSSSKRNRRHVSDDEGEESAAGPSTSKRARPSPDVSGAVELDPEGDAIFAFKNPDSASDETIKFLVSSKVLSLASPVFCKMFSPQFQEGTRVRNGERPCIDLEEDDPTAMNVILRILHFQSDDISFDLSRAEFASIAVHSDKYDCRRALRGWVRGWWHANEFDAMFDLTSEEVGLTLLAAYMFRFTSLPRLAADAAKHLKPDFLGKWQEHETISLLPETLKVAVHTWLADGVDYVQGRLQAIEGSLLRPGKGYLVPFSWECLHCGKLFEYGDGPADMKCSCGRTVVERYCTTQSRVCDYLNILRLVGLHHSFQPFKTLSILQIAIFVKEISGYRHTHICQGKERCPLVVQLRDLCLEVDHRLDLMNVERFECVGLGSKVTT